MKDISKPDIATLVKLKEAETQIVRLQIGRASGRERVPSPV